MTTSQLIESSASQLMAKARQQTGIDIVDADIEERLDRLVQSLNSDAALTPSGAASMEARLLRLLGNRLRMQRDLRRHPEIQEQEIVRPVFLTSAPRTGSTKLHRMLVASGDYLGLEAWQGLTLALRTGNREEDLAPRVRDSQEYEAWFEARSPEGMQIHEYRTFEADEDSLLLEHCLFGLYLMAFAFVPTYGQWYAGVDFHGDMAFVKQGLQYLQWQFHDGDPRPWVLKCPGYFGRESVVAEFFPDAVFVTTNRHPCSTMPSTASLLSNYHKLYSEANRDPILGMMMLEGFAAATQQHMAARDSDPQLESKFMDVGYGDLTKKASDVIDRVYAHAGMTLSDQARQTMAAWDEENHLDKRPIHAYRLEDYSLTPALVESKFADYISRFADYL